MTAAGARGRTSFVSVVKATGYSRLRSRVRQRSEREASSAHLGFGCRLHGADGLGRPGAGSNN